MIDKKKQGKKNRVSGVTFERKVRIDLESKGWIVDKWTNNLDYPENNINLPPEDRKERKIVPAKHKFRGKGIPMALGTGFPDFIAFRKGISREDLNIMFYEIIAVEAKSNGYLDKTEREKCKWLLKEKVFSKILIASKVKVGRRVEVKYKEFEYTEWKNE